MQEMTNNPPGEQEPMARATRSRVLMIIESSAGGTGRHVLDLAEGLLARGCEVHLVWSSRRVDSLFQRRLESLAGARHISFPIRTAPHPSDLAIAWKLRRYMRQRGPFDVVHGHSSKGGALARLVGLGTGARVIYTLHGLIMMDPGLGWLKKRIYTAIELLLSLWTRRVIAVSPEEARAAVRLGLGRSRVELIPNGVGPADLTPRAVARSEMGVDDDAVVIGFIGRLVEQKDPQVLLKGFAAAARVEPSARLALVGAGPLEQSMRQCAAELGIDRQIIWLGERDARQVMSGFDAFAIASRKEGLPYVVLESMAAGLGIVATASSGVEILVEDGANGFVVPTGDAKAFGDALVRLVGDPSRLAGFGEASRRRAGQFTIDAMVERTLSVYGTARNLPESPVRNTDDRKPERALVCA